MIRSGQRSVAAESQINMCLVSLVGADGDVASVPVYVRGIRHAV